MKKGIKAPVVEEPLDLRRLPKDGPERVIRWIHRYGVVPHGKGAGKPLRLRPWQQDIVRAMYAKPRPRAGLVSLPRGNGKTGLAAALALFELFAGNEASPQVLTVASDERQARIVFDAVRRMIELQPDLKARTLVYRDHLRVPYNDGELWPMPSQAAALQGYRPTFTVVDELHVVTEEVWDAIVMASGKNEHSLALAISTPGADQDSVMWRLVELGRSGADPSFRLIEYAAPAGCDLADEQAWKAANPALGDFLRIDALRASLKTSREAAFRRYRLGQWVGSEGAWMPWEAWAACAERRQVEPRTEIVIGFDGSASGDSTTAIAATVSEQPHVFVLGLWANPGTPGWRVPRQEVTDTLADAFEQYDVLEVACDPFGWRSEIQSWADTWPGRVVELPTNHIPRMAPATDRFRELVMERRLTHDGDPRLAAHIANAVATTTPAGDVIRKDARHRDRKIDMAVAAILAVDRASWHLTHQPQPTGAWFL